MANYKKQTTDIETDIKEIETSTKPFNCLRKERVIVRFVPKTNGMVTDKRHILYGGMAESTTRSFVVPKTGSGFANILTQEEQKCLEDILGMERGSLSSSKKDDNFWDDSNENGINRVVLHKQDNYFDLSNPEDYIKYKILLANPTLICPSQSVLQNRPIETYQFVIISEGIEENMAASKLEIRKQSYIELGRIQDDIDRLRLVLSFLEKKNIAPTTKIGFLQDKIVDYVDENPKSFLKIVQDKYFDTKVTIQKAIDRGIIVKRGTYYYDKETNSPLCENNEEPTLAAACKYLNSAKNDNVKFSIEKKIAES